MVELTSEEKLLHAIFGEKTREVRDTSLRVPHGGDGIVHDVKIFSKKDNDEIPIYDYLKFVKDNQNLFIKEFVRIDNTLSGTGLDSEHNLGINGALKSQWDSAYAVTEAYKVTSGDFLKTVSTDGTTISGNGATTPLGLDGSIADEIHAAIKYVHCDSTQHAFSGIGASGAGNLFGIDETGMAATKQYGWDYDTHAWTEIQGGGDYLPLSGGTIHGETVISGGQNNFDGNFLKFVLQELGLRQRKA